MRGEDFVEAEHFRKILGIVEREFLPVEIADRRMRFHDDSRFVAVDARHECAVNRRDETSSNSRVLPADHAAAIPRVLPKKLTSGPVMTVVTRAMITSMVKMRCERMPMS